MVLVGGCGGRGGGFSAGGEFCDVWKAALPAVHDAAAPEPAVLEASHGEADLWQPSAECGGLDSI